MEMATGMFVLVFFYWNGQMCNNGGNMKTEAISYIKKGVIIELLVEHMDSLSGPIGWMLY